MRSWIALHLPLLPLEAIRPRWSLPGEHVIVERERVIAASPQAHRGGICIGMRRAGAQAMCPSATLHERDHLREREVLDGITLALLQYTPEVALGERGSLLLDVTASLRAFGGRRALCRLVRHSVGILGLTPQLGMAPTAQGAWLLACRERKELPAHRRVVCMESMTRRLDTLPCTLLPQTWPYLEWLDGIGCRSFADLRKLPRAGLQRRCDKSVLDALDRAYGQAPELFDWIQAPKSFSAKLELPDRIEHAEAVLFAAHRLLLQLTGWLVTQQLAVSRFVLQLEHERGRAAIPPTPIEIALAEPAWHEEHLTRLLKERLGRIELAAPVIAVRLEIARVTAMLPPTESLFPEPGSIPMDYHRLLELLTARLGEQNVLAPAPRADHRPEICNGWVPTAAPSPPSTAVTHLADRPFWLLLQPVELMVREDRPFYGSPLRLVKGPERIECGWWDGGLIMRDYFIAQGETSTLYWIYQERHGDEICWYLQGLFA
ncbi:Y-family DNA polymerase [Noviherbaspirillum saxi]|uniref:DNA polymerase Y family protein n=1 Tax=Noviherbaspirillum saxi TaxID=2320863 RepID=A0A3A3FV40_9BURK|nr:DNA polymerase Y family protein [Noviherbaspirillum saxi]RJF98428.1 DNA polymerase Y family protein [Noviherbaspirillum saxi]